ncbi:MAG: hypothetical protein AAF716_19330 [Cyanobacteria bacterium P01_D01_bin.1]
MGSWRSPYRRYAHRWGDRLRWYLFDFPNWEKQRLPAQLRSTLQANLAYFQVTISQYLHQCNQTQYKQSQYKQSDRSQGKTQAIEPTRSTVTSSLHRLRHQAALQNANAEAAAQRLFSEPHHVRGEIEPMMSLMLYIRSLFGSTATLAEHLKDDIEDERFCYVEQLSNAIEKALLNLADVIAKQRHFSRCRRWMTI